MSTLSKRRWISRLASGAVASLAAAGFVWAIERGLGIRDPNDFRIFLAAIVGAIVGILGKMLVDEVARK